MTVIEAAAGQTIYTEELAIPNNWSVGVGVTLLGALLFT